MPLTTLTARRLLTDIGEIEFPVLTISDDGTIADISSDSSVQGNETLTAAFLDIHTHGAAGRDVMDTTPGALTAVSRFLATHGVAHFLPTTVTAPIDATLRSLEALAAAIEAPATPGTARPIGIHLEGPFLSHQKRGVHPADLLQPATVDLFDRFQAAARGHIRLLTLAPELHGAVDLIAHATASGVRVSGGHTDATAAQTLAAIRAGAASATHTFNAMRPLDHREPGVLGTVLDQEQIYAEIIADGIHVRPELIRLWLRAKSPDHAILVTDSISATGMGDGHYTLGGLDVEVQGDICRLADAPETLAGSVLTMDRAVSNVQRFTGAPLSLATRLASHNPARMLGLDALTRIAPRQPAHLNRFSSTGRLIATYIGGKGV